MPTLRSAAMAALLSVCVAMLCLTGPWLRAEDWWSDTAFTLLRHLYSTAPATRIVVVGIDDAFLRQTGRPLAQLTPALGRLVSTIGQAHARAIALDFALPWDQDDTLPIEENGLRDLLAWRARLPIVVGVDAGSLPLNPASQRLRAAVMGPTGLGDLRVTMDNDGVLRRLTASELAPNRQPAPLAVVLARRLGHSATPGLVDFALGGEVDFVTAADVVSAAQRSDSAWLLGRFAGSVVLIGGVFPDIDRHPLPRTLLAPVGTDSPGVAFQAQLLRSLLSDRMIPIDTTPAWLMALAIAAMLWGYRNRPIAVGVLCLMGTPTLLLTSLAALAAGRSVPVVPALTTLVLASILVWIAHAWRAHVERLMIRRLFTGYVGEPILASMLSGQLQWGRIAARQHVAFLFADIRGFTQYCKQHEPETVVAFLNRYYAAIVPVIHCHGGTLDKFSGDGCMAFFGAPQPLDNPARAAIDAGCALLAAVAEFNAAEAGAERETIAVGIGIAAGPAILGNIGTGQRHDFTATSTATNLAAHIQQHCKQVPFSLLVDRTTFNEARLIGPTAALFIALDNQILEKHGNLALMGFNDARCAP